MCLPAGEGLLPTDAAVPEPVPGLGPAGGTAGHGHAGSRDVDVGGGAGGGEAGGAGADVGEGADAERLAAHTEALNARETGGSGAGVGDDASDRAAGGYGWCLCRCLCVLYVRLVDVLHGVRNVQCRGVHVQSVML